MRRLIGVLAVLAFTLPAMPADAHETLLHVDDGDFFYDSTPGDDVCAGDTNDPQGEAVRHWHVGIPFAGPEAEPLGGFGCLGGPKTYGPITVTEEVEVTGSITYTWDTQVPGGCCNDVHLHVYDADGNRVFSTFDVDGYQPIIPMVSQVDVHEISATLGPGEYTFVEDVFAGEHSAWLTKLDVVGH